MMTGKMGQSENGAQRCHERIVKNVFNITSYVDTQANEYVEKNEKLFIHLAHFLHCQTDHEAQQLCKLTLI